MNKLLQHRTFIRENLALVIGVCLCVYFSYHAIYGSRSFLRLMNLQSSIATMSQEVDMLKANQGELEGKVAAMRPGNLSRDLLEERARAVLGYRHPDEFTVLGN